MKKMILVSAATILTSLNVFAGVKTERGSVYTDMKNECVVVSTATDQAPIDFYHAECKAFGGYRLTLTGGDLRYHPALYFGSTELNIPTPPSFHEPASDKVEWVYEHTIDQEGFGQLVWKALIYRLNVVDENNPEQNIEKLFVVRLDGEKSCLLGTAQTNEKARELAYSTRSCK